MLNFLNYNEFGSLVELTDDLFRVSNLKNMYRFFFTFYFKDLSFQHANLHFYAINKILSRKNASELSLADTQFLKRLQFWLEQNLETKMFPVHCSTNAIALLVKLQNFSRPNVSLQYLFMVS